MTFLRVVAYGFGVIGLVLVAVLVIGFLLPGEWEAERERTFAYTPEAIYPFLASAEAWTRWTPGPDTGVELFGPDIGEGSGHRWDDPGYGQGRFVIAEAEPPARVSYEVAVEGGSIRIEGTVRLERVVGGTRVVWRERGDFGWNPLLGFLAGRMGDLQGAQLEASLESLARLLEGDGSVAAKPRQRAARLI